MNEEFKTPHINPTGKIAKTVLMPGDPLRAKYIAENFLENVVQFNSVRGMLGYTGTYKGREISVMGSGMGMPTIGIYSYELYKFYGVENIIRIGSAGAYTADLNLYDVILATECWSQSTFAQVASGETKDVLKSSEELNEKIREFAKDLDVKLIEGRIHSSDVFYSDNKELSFHKYYEDHGCIAVEMESFALYANANTLGKKATCLITISDSLVTHEATSAEEREVALKDMIKVALEFAE